ncbi:MAG TPA: type IV pili methyl-accepting chemotaxis transducer N-terminal domain-containing protein, partial [Xanthomonadales bacterium]|nr:type IV pili methyl-accepting chemotaxis transducer N-terminal domain-containing protein [Xanthomonadales bacterium]
MSTPSGALKGQSSSIRFWLLLLAVALLLLVANTYLSGVKNDEERAALVRVNDVQVQSQQIATYAREAAGGNLDAFSELKATRDSIDRNVTQLLKGAGSEMPGYETESAVAVPLKKLSSTWEPIKRNADTILGRQQLVLDMTDTAADFNSKIPLLTARMEEIVRVLTERDAPSTQIYMATRQMLLADRMLRRVSEILKGGDLAVTAADSFGRDAQIYGRVLDGLMNGSTDLNIRALTDPQAKAILGEVFNIFNEVGQNVDKIQGASTDLFEVTEAADAIVLDSQSLLNESKNAAVAFQQLPTKRPGQFPGLPYTILAGVLAILALAGAAWAYNSGQRRQMQATADLNQRNQEAILRLLDEMGSLAEGDLTVKATVTEDITGAIADSINFAVEALRSLVTTINETAVQVAAAAQETQATAMHLAEAAEHQAQQITSASAAINEIAVSIDEVSK